MLPAAAAPMGLAAAAQCEAAPAGTPAPANDTAHTQHIHSGYMVQHTQTQHTHGGATC
jgi:hypothetical protein